MSQGVLDEGMQEHFQPGKERELKYGEGELAPLMFQDDFLHGAGRLEDAGRASAKVNKMIKERVLKLNEKKSVCLIIGTTKQKQQITKQLKEKPLMCGDVQIKEANVDKWLGQQMSAAGLADSVMETIKAKEGKVRGACLEVAAITEDWRAQATGALMQPLFFGRLAASQPCSLGPGIGSISRRRLSSDSSKFKTGL